MSESLMLRIKIMWHWANSSIYSEPTAYQSVLIRKHFHFFPSAQIHWTKRLRKLRIGSSMNGTEAKKKKHHKNQRLQRRPIKRNMYTYIEKKEKKKSRKEKLLNKQNRIFLVSYSLAGLSFLCVFFFSSLAQQSTRIHRESNRKETRNNQQKKKPKIFFLVYCETSKSQQQHKNKA